MADTINITFDKLADHLKWALKKARLYAYECCDDEVVEYAKKLQKKYFGENP